MKLVHKYYLNSKHIRKTNLFFMADCLGLIASGLCFIHCWLMPLLLLLLPGLTTNNKWVHPVLCTVALASTVPLIKNKVRLQTGLFQLALALGTIIMLIILLAHDHLSFKGELVLNTIGGASLMFVHCKHLGVKHKSCNH